MEITPRCAALLPELEALAVCAEQIEATEAALEAPFLDSDKNHKRTQQMRHRQWRTALWRYKAARKALDARSRELALDQQEGLRVDPGALWDATDDDDEIPGEATVRARRKIRERRLAAPTGDPGYWNRKNPVQAKWGNRSVIPHELGPREALA